jgi:hypothetical protein
MSIGFPSRTSIVADLVAYDAEGQPILLVKTKAGQAVLLDMATVLGSLLLSNPPIRFGMIVDSEKIRMIDREAPGSGHVLVLSTPEILGHYDPEFSRKRIFDNYLTVLVESWLRDLAMHWKSANPPAQGSVASTGLLEGLRGGTTRMEAPLHGDFIP